MMDTGAPCKKAGHIVNVRPGTGNKKLINNEVEGSNFGNLELANTGKEKLSGKRNCQRTSKFFSASI